MPATVTGARIALGGYAAKQCPATIYHDLVTDPSLAAPVPTGVQARMDEGVAFEAAVGAQLTTALGLYDLTKVSTDGHDVASLAQVLRRRTAVAVPVCDRSEESKARRELFTLAAMAAGVRVIWNARFPVDTVEGRAGEPDMLVRADEKTAEGRFAYLPVDVKHHKSLDGTAKARPWPVSDLAAPGLLHATSQTIGAGTTRWSDDCQLAHYHRMLEALGHAAPTPWAGIIGKELVVVWRRLDVVVQHGAPALAAYDAAWAIARDVADRAIADPDAGPAIGCLWEPGCRDSIWRVVLHDELVDADSIALLPGITPRRYAVHAARGVTTRAQLARLDHATAQLVDAGIDLTGRDGIDAKTASYAGTGKTLAEEIDQARVAKAGAVHRARGRGFVSIPRATFELDVDIEDADGRMYMIGVADTWRRTRNGSTKVRTDVHTFVDWTRTDEGEARVFAEFWSYLVAAQAKAAENKWGLKVYHYTDHETRYFRSLAKKHAGAPGVPTLDELNVFLESDAWVDLHKVVSRELIWPTENQTLKTIAKHTGFAWRDEEPGGANSVAWYLAATGSDDEMVREAMRDRIVAYNEDDILATLAIRDWLTRQGEARRPGERIPAVDVLEARFRRRRKA